MPDLFKVLVNLDEANSDSEHHVERIVVSDQGSGGYRVDCIPWFARHIDRGDIISVSFDGSEPTFDGVIKRGGHVTYHVELTEKMHSPELAPLLSDILGGMDQLEIEREYNGTHFFSVDVPPGKSPIFVKDLLAVGEDAGLLIFESSESGDRWGTSDWVEE